MTALEKFAGDTGVLSVQNGYLDVAWTVSPSLWNPTRPT